jgi:dTMP kinase
LAAGGWVVCDRFLDSSRAYQGAGGLDDGIIRKLHDIGSEGLLPDLTILVTVSPSVAAERLATRDNGASDRIGGRPAEYHVRVAAAFAAFAREEPERFAVIDGDGTPEATHAFVLQAIERLLV